MDEDHIIAEIHKWMRCFGVGGYLTDKFKTALVAAVEELIRQDRALREQAVETR